MPAELSEAFEFAASAKGFDFYISLLSLFTNASGAAMNSAFRSRVIVSLNSRPSFK